MRTSPLFGVVFVLLLSASYVTFVLPAPGLFLSPRIVDGNWQSLNWSGYAVTGSAGSVTDAKGSWIVPTVTCALGETSYSSFWVGIDGFSSSTVEQTGTDSDCRNGQPTYYAWFEFFPKPAFLISGITVHAGDAISAEVKYAGQNKFVVSITDTLTGKSFSTTGTVGGAQRSSAEWIAEAPSSGGGILPLANFGTVSFSAGLATVAGAPGAIGSFGSSVQVITMVTSSGAVKALPSALSADGTSFSVTWKSSGP